MFTEKTKERAHSKAVREILVSVTVTAWSSRSFVSFPPPFRNYSRVTFWPKRARSSVRLAAEPAPASPGRSPFENTANVRKRKYWSLKCASSRTPPPRPPVSFTVEKVEITNRLLYFSRLARGPVAFLRGARLTNVADQRAGRESLGCVAERELAGLRAHWRTPVHSHRVGGERRSSGGCCKPKGEKHARRPAAEASRRPLLAAAPYGGSSAVQPAKLAACLRETAYESRPRVRPDPTSRTTVTGRADARQRVTYARRHAIKKRREPNDRT